MKIATICFQEYEDVEHIYYDISGVDEKKWLKWIGGEFIGFTTEAKKIQNARKNVEKTIKSLELELKISENYVEKNKHRTKEDWEKIDKAYWDKLSGGSGYFMPPSEEWKEDKEHPKELKKEIKEAKEVLCQ